MRFTELRVIRRNERALAYLDFVVPRSRIGHNLPWIILAPLAFLVLGGVVVVWFMSGAQAAQVQPEAQAAYFARS